MFPNRSLWCNPPLLLHQSILKVHFLGPRRIESLLADKFSFGQCLMAPQSPWMVWKLIGLDITNSFNEGDHVVKRAASNTTTPEYEDAADRFMGKVLGPIIVPIGKWIIITILVAFLLLLACGALCGLGHGIYLLCKNSDCFCSRRRRKEIKGSKYEDVALEP